MSSSKHLKMTVTYAPSTLRAMQESENVAKKAEHSSSSGAASAAQTTATNTDAAPPPFAVRAPLSVSALALLHSGGHLTAYIPDVEGSSCGSYYTRVIQLWFAPEQAALYWAEPGAKICRASRAIPVAQLRGLQVGKHSDVLSWSAISADPARCFSLVWSLMPAPSAGFSSASGADETAELSVEAPTEAERNDWLSALDHVISASGRTVIEQPMETETSAHTHTHAHAAPRPDSLLNHAAHISLCCCFVCSDSPGPSPTSRSPATSAIACSPARKSGGRSPTDLLGSAVDLSSALRRERRFIVVDRDPLSLLPKPADQTASDVPSSGSPAYGAGDQLSSSAPNLQSVQTLLQWMDVNHNNAAAAAAAIVSPSSSPTAASPLTPMLTSSAPAASPVSSDSSDGAPAGAPPTRMRRQRTRASMFIDSRSAAALVASANAVPPPASPSAGNRGSGGVPKSPFASPTAAAAATAAASSPLAPKDDPKSLEGSLNRLAQGVPFRYCAPPFDEEDGLLANAAATAAAGSTAAFSSAASAATAAAAAAAEDDAAAASAVDLPGQVPSSSSSADSAAASGGGAAAAAASSHARRPSLTDAHRSILLFYAPVSRRASGRAGNFGQLSWCDSQTWTRRGGWKQSLHVDSVILLGKRTRNFQRAEFAHLPEGECFSIVHDDGGYGGGAAGGVDLHAEGGWPAIRAWLTDVDRVLRSCGFAMVRAPSSSPTNRDTASAASSAGSTGSGVHSLPLRSAPMASSCSKLLFVSQSELKPAKAWNALNASAAAAVTTISGGSPSLSHKPPLSLAPSVSVGSSAPSSAFGSSNSSGSFASSAAGSGANTPSLAALAAHSGSAAFSLSLPAAATAAAAASSHSPIHIHSRGDSGALNPSPRSSGRGQRSQLAPLDRHLSVSTSALSAARASSPSPPPTSPGALNSLHVLGGGSGGAWDTAAAAPAAGSAAGGSSHHGRIPSHSGGSPSQRERVEAARAKRASNRKSTELPPIASHARSGSPLPALQQSTLWQCSGPL